MLVVSVYLLGKQRGFKVALERAMSEYPKLSRIALDAARLFERRRYGNAHPRRLWKARQQGVLGQIDERLRVELVDERSQRLIARYRRVARMQWRQGIPLR